MKQNRTGPYGVLSQYGQYLGLGLEFAASLLLFILLGRYLDQRYGTDPLFTLAGSAMGFAVGFYHMFKTLSGLSKRKENKDKGDS